MVAYEYYWHDEIKGFELIGVLPERRKDSDRVTQKSILGFGKKFWGAHMNNGNILFIRVTVDKKTGEIFRPKPPLGFDFERTDSRKERQGVRAGTTFVYP